MGGNIYYENKKSIVTDATMDHVEALSANLRAADLAEIWASHRMNGRQALQSMLKRSDVCLTVIHKGIPCVMFGTVPFTLLGGAAPWALGSDDIEKIKLPFVRYSRFFVQAMLRQHGYLENYADARNMVALEWLRFCGFDIEPARPYGPDQIPFHRFTMTKG